MNSYENGVIKYQINLERYKNGQANEVIALLDNANKEISYFIKRIDDVPTKERYKEIAKKLRSVSANLKKKVEKNIDIDGILEYELKKQKDLLKLSKSMMRHVKGGSINFIYPTVEQIKTSALFKPVDKNMTFQSYLDGIESGLYNTWDTAVRTGYLTGMSTHDIVENVMGKISKTAQLAHKGTMDSMRNYVHANTRTVIQSFANETRNRVFEENEKYFGDYDSDGEFYRYEYLATLDNRTCIVCGECDGKLYKTLADAPQIPQHRGCRCLIIPYFNIEGETRSSEKGYIKKITFEEWLKEQDDKTQYEVLGVARKKLFDEGKTMEQFVDNGEVLTLKQLGEKGLLESSEEVKTSSELDNLLDKGRKQWNGKVNLNFDKKDKAEIADYLLLNENEVDDYIAEARKVVNNYLSAKDTEIVHYDWSDIINSDDFWKDPRIKSQFETQRTNAFYNPEKRRVRENELLNGSEKMEDKYRPIYATAVKNKKIFEEDRYDYGNIGIVLNKEKLKDRISYTMGDSLNHLRNHTFQKDFGTALSKPNYTIDVISQLQNYQDMFKNGEFIDKDDYLEAQIWGGIDFRKGDVKAIILNKKTIRDDAIDKVNKLIERCKQYNIDVIIQEEWK